MEPNMKTIIFTFINIIILLGLTSCAGSGVVYLPIEGNPSISTRFVDGNKVVMSREIESTLSIISVKKHKGFLSIDISVTNDGQNDFNVMSDNLTILAYNAENKSNNLKVYTPKSYLKKLQRKQQRRNAMAAVGGSLQNMSAGQSSSTSKTEVSGNVFTSSSSFGSSNSTIRGTATTKTTTIDKDAQRKANKELQQEMVNRRMLQNAHNQNTESLLLKANTLLPNQTVGGRIMVDYSSFYNKKLILSFKAGKDVHKIEFK